MDEKGYATHGDQAPILHQPEAPPGYDQGPAMSSQQYGYNMQPTAGFSNPNYGQPGQPMPNYGQPGMPPPPPGAPIAPVITPQVQMPEPIPGVPTGLEYLVTVDQLLIHQQMELLEILTTLQTNNKYVIKNSVGQQVYYCAEESNPCMRQCCGPKRGFILHISDNFGNEVIRVSREFKCCAGVTCCAFSDCCAFEVVVEAPVGTVIGYIKQECSFIKPNLAIHDADHQPLLRLTGKLCQCQGVCCPQDLSFELLTYDGTSEVGAITKQWGGVLREALTNADNFALKFPADLDVRVKATCLATVFLLDFMYFETPKNNRRNYNNRY